MAVLLPNRYLFLAHPRTGSSAVTRALLQEPGAIHIANHHAGIDHPDVLSVWNGEPAFCFIRNPKEMVVTWWLKFRRQRGNSHQQLRHFIKNFEHKIFTRGGHLFYHADVCPHVLRFERGLSAGLKSLGINQAVPKVNVTPDKDASTDYYDAGALEALRERFGAEAEFWGYKL